MHMLQLKLPTKLPEQDNPMFEASILYIDLPRHLSLVLKHTRQLSLSAIAYTLFLYQFVRDSLNTLI